MMTDPIADMLTRIRNATQAGKAEVSLPSSKLKEQVAGILASEGFIDGFETSQDGVRRGLKLRLKYGAGRTPVINGIQRVSKPGRRVYLGAGDLPRSHGGLGVLVISTSQGLLPDREARRRSLGGEVMCEVW
jgi:small subunit ribosomal protein S8